MKKTLADKIITEYYDKLFGFALSKISSIDKAEELASRITLEVYSSLLKSDEVVNVNGYIYRIACNVYARFIAESKGSAHLDLETVNVPVCIDFAKDIIDSETAKVSVPLSLSWRAALPGGALPLSSKRRKCSKILRCGSTSATPPEEFLLMKSNLLK